MYIFLHKTDGLVVVDRNVISIVEGNNGKTRIFFLSNEHAPLDFNYDIYEFCYKVFCPDDTELLIGADGIESIEIYEKDEDDKLDENKFRELI